jgi:hypothetical protein
MTPREQHELLMVVGALFDRTLEPSNASQFAHQLATDVEARRLYTDLVGLNVDLEWSCNTHSQRDLFAAGTGIIVPDKVATEPNRFPNDANLEPAKSVVFRFCFGKPRYSLFSQPVLWCAALVGLCLYGSFTLVAWNLRPDKLPSVVTGSPGSVAMVRDTTDVQWSKNAASKPAESSILSGELLTIESGVVQLELKRGVTLLVEGPARWSIEGDNRATLKSGKIVAKVPPQAIGFSIETPTATVVDLGTEFSVTATEQGPTEVQVLRGRVELHAKALPGQSPPPVVTLHAGFAGRVELSADGAPTIREIAHDPQRFAAPVRQTPRGSIRVAGVLASSQCLPERDVYDLVNGAGLVADEHSNDPDAMWISQMHKVKGEYVLFDLGKPYRLESMKVWNYNENTVQPFFKMCGVKQASIYTSLSGRFDATAQPNTWDAKLPEAWHVVAAHRPFAMADGTSACKPIVIPLDGIEARFVAIVIDDHFGEVAGLSLDHHDVVGLSEVQFFGKPVSPVEK